MRSDVRYESEHLTVGCLPMKLNTRRLRRLMDMDMNSLYLALMALVRLHVGDLSNLYVTEIEQCSQILLLWNLGRSLSNEATKYQMITFISCRISPHATLLLCTNVSLSYRIISAVRRDLHWSTAFRPVIWLFRQVASSAYRSLESMHRLFPTLQP